MPEYTYDAFISYRHRPVDMAVAEKLIKLLEQMKGPDGKKLHVFRDRDELPTDSDLGSSIRRGLADSRYLIVVCSPAYKESKWCMEELHYFRQLQGNSNARILPILVEGEPEEAFPPELRWEERTITDEDGTQRRARVEMEPLGADIRAGSHRQRMRLLRTEYLRLAAPILGKTFDQLYQRNRRRSRRLMALAMAMLLTFAVYSIAMFSRIKMEHNDMLAMESLRLAMESQKKLEEGDHQLAMLLALEALPDDLRHPDRPVIDEALAALRSAVYTQQMHRETAIAEPISLVPGNTFEGLFAHGTKVAMSDPDRLCVYDTTTGKLLLSYPSDYNMPAALNSDASLVANSHRAGRENDMDLYTAEIWDPETGTALYQETFQTETPVLALWDPMEQLWYFYTGHPYYASENEQILKILLPDGTPADRPLPDAAAWEQIKDRSLELIDARKEEMDWEPDYSSRKGALTELGKRYEKQILNALPSNKDSVYYWEACITADEQLLLIYSGGIGVAVALGGMDCAYGSQELKVTGRFYWSDKYQRLYADLDDGFQTFAFHPENKGVGRTFGGGWYENLDMISNDGKLCIYDSFENVGNMSNAYYFKGQPEELAIYSCDNLERPLLHLNYLRYHVTPDLRHVFLDTGDGVLQLWHVEKGLLLELAVTEPVAQVCVRADGEMVAFALDSGCAQVYQASDGVRIMEFSCPETTEDCGVKHMEFEENLLLLTGGGYETGCWSRIVDITGQTETMEIKDGSLFKGTAQYASDFSLTADGLMLTGCFDNSEALGAIYDLKTGACVFRGECLYQYDEESGTLLYLPYIFMGGSAYTLHAARRDKTGSFQDVYTVSLRETYSSLMENDRCLGSPYVILSGGNCSEMYEIATGKHVLSIRNPQGVSGIGRYFLVGETLYNLQYHMGNKVVSLPLPDLLQMKAQAEEFLTSPLGKRILTDEEKRTYFIG